MMKRAGIYNRCSTEEEAQVNALAIQAAESREIVISKGWQIAEQYIESESGTGAQKRREYQRLLQDMEKDKFDIIVIKSIDRLMRSVKDWYLFLDKLTQNNKQLYIYIDHKFYTPDDSLLTGIKAILAEDFSRELSKKIKNAHKRRQSKKTGVNITRPMFGWDKVGKDAFLINEEEAEAYRLAFALAKEGKGFYSIANILYEKGVRSKSGIRISDVQWRKMIYSPRAHGTVVLHTTEYDFETKKKVKVPEAEWIYVENALPPIVSKAYQMEVLEMVKSRTEGGTFKEYTRKKTAVGLYELSGRIYCGNCGKVYYRSVSGSGTGRCVEWKCSTALKMGRKNCSNMHITEEAVWDTIEKNCKRQYETWFDREEERGEEVEKKADITEDILFLLRKMFSERNGEAELKKQKKELDKMQNRKKLLLQKFLEGVIDDTDFQRANGELKEKINLLQQGLSGMKAQTGAYINREERLSKIREALQKGLLDRAKTKAFVAGIDKIFVYPDGRLELVFDKETKMFVLYEHKNKAAGKREKINCQILELLKDNPSITLKEAAAGVGVSQSYIYTSVRQLKEKKLLHYERYGNTHTGRWIVTEYNWC